MSVKVQCPSCKKTTSVPEKYLGRKAECPSCKTKFVLEQLTDEAELVGAAASSSAASSKAAASGKSSSTSKPQAEEVHEEPSKPAPFTVPHSSESHENMVDMTAMVDIVFFLLVFFIMTSILAMTSSIAMPVPKQESNQQSGGKASKVADIQEQGESLTVKVDAENKISIDGAEIPSEQDLLIRLRAEKAKFKKMLVMGHANSTHGTIVMVMDAGNDVGFESLMLSVVDDEK